MEKSLLSDINKVLIDFRDLSFENIPRSFNDNMQRVIQYRKHINKNLKNYENTTVVFWVDKPIPTFIATIYMNSMDNMNYHYCSSEEKVLSILGLPDSVKLDDLIHKLDSVMN